MSPLLIVILSAAAALIALVLTVLIRTMIFKPEKAVKAVPSSVELDKDKAVADLAELIRCKTVSDRNKELEDEAEFEKLKETLKKLYPNVFSVCGYTEVGPRALLFKWTGESSDSPAVLMSHYDVVSVEEAMWDKPPFEGIVEDGVLWGRGTLDTKGTLNGVLGAADRLIKKGFKPKNDIYFAFGGDEEINGTGADSIVKLFAEQGIVPAFVLDEGGAVVENVFPGVKSPCALIGINEKGMLNLEYTVSGGGGHASSPAKHTPVGRLSLACSKVEAHPFKYRITAPTRKMFDTLARHSTFVYRMIFANLWLFNPILSLITKKSGGELNALVRTTVAFTQMEGSKGMNVIPAYARMVSNSRILPGETIESTVEHIKKTVNDDKVEIRVVNGMEPSRISVTDCEAFKTISETVVETWTNAVVSPYPMLACSDSAHWGAISDKVYRFSAMALSKEERATIHGNNERIPEDTVVKTVEFYTRLMKKC